MKGFGFRRVALAVILLLILSLGSGICVGSERQLPRYAELVILHTNDVHGHLFPFDYGEEKNVGGAARRASLINLFRWESENPVIVVDAGDIFFGGPLASAYKGAPDFAVMNAMAYDAVALGNHEFEGGEGLAGQENLFKRIRQAKFAVLSANLTTKKTGEPIVPSYVILERGGIKIGIFGLTAPRVAGCPQAEGLQLDDPIETAGRTVPLLKDQADVVIALTHIGYDLDKQLALRFPDIDVIIGGDSHTWLHRPEVVKPSSELYAFWVGGPLVAQDGEWGKCVGSVDVILRRHGEHDYRVMSFRGELLPVNDTIEPAKEIENILKRYPLPR